MLGPGVVVVERHEPRVLRLVLAVAEPVVHLELDPGAREQVERRRGQELMAGQQLAADDPLMGSLGSRFGRNVPLEDTVREPEDEAARRRTRASSAASC